MGRGAWGQRTLSLGAKSCTQLLAGPGDGKEAIVRHELLIRNAAISVCIGQLELGGCDALNVCGLHALLQAAARLSMICLTGACLQTSSSQWLYQSLKMPPHLPQNVLDVRIGRRCMRIVLCQG